MLMLIEVCNASDAVLDPVVKGFDNKTPKLVAACEHVVTAALSAFGPKVVSPKMFMKELPKLFGHTDKLVRDEVGRLVPCCIRCSQCTQAKALTVELYRWLGDALKPGLSELKPVQACSTDLSLVHTLIVPPVDGAWRRLGRPAQDEGNADTLRAGRTGQTSGGSSIWCCGSCCGWHVCIVVSSGGGGGRGPVRVFRAV